MSYWMLIREAVQMLFAMLVNYQTCLALPMIQSIAHTICEHYYRHDAVKVLAGFVHVLKADGFAFIRVPDLGELMRTVVEKNLDIDDFLYQSPAGPITVRDVIYGYGVEVERSGNDFFAHKTGFTQKSLMSILKTAGFPWVFSGIGNLEVMALAFSNKPNEHAEKLFHLPSHKQTNGSGLDMTVSG